MKITTKVLLVCLGGIVSISALAHPRPPVTCPSAMLCNPNGNCTVAGAPLEGWKIRQEQGQHGGKYQFYSAAIIPIGDKTLVYCTYVLPQSVVGPGPVAGNTSVIYISKNPNPQTRIKYGPYRHGQWSSAGGGYDCSSKNPVNFMNPTDCQFKIIGGPSN